MNNIVAVIVTYNRIDMLRQCIQHVQAQTVLCDILIIDNASTDGTEVFVKQLADTIIHYYNTGENLGGAGGFNLGMKLAVERGYDYVWIMDDDCLPQNNALEKLIDANNILNGKYGWLSSKCLWIDGSICSMNVQRDTPYADIKDFSKSMIAAEMASFVSLFLKANTIQKYGLPIKDFFIWTDDWEYTRRISRRLPCYVVTDSQVIHAMKTNTVVNIATDSRERLPRYKYFYRNDVYFYRREGIKGCVWILAKDIWHSAQIIAKRKDIVRKLKIVWENAVKGIFFNPKIEYCKQIDNKGLQK